MAPTHLAAAVTCYRTGTKYWIVPRGVATTWRSNSMDRELEFVCWTLAVMLREAFGCPVKAIVGVGVGCAERTR